ncbi:MAG: tRNA adenosine(34) deaminase TadA [Clostridia bacterium]|nr:tRNA adenosine(34) deaminase TadA [Clostridia bacterium]
MTGTEIMLRAIELAKKAAELDEVPVGAVVVKDGEIVGEGFNRRETGKNALAHAELEAIDNACKRLGGWRLHQCEIYVTLEPCPMCTGAIINSRLKRIVFGAYDPKAGSVGSVVNLCDLPYNHKPEIQGGFMREQCSSLLTEFFARLRERRKQEGH